MPVQTSRSRRKATWKSAFQDLDGDIHALVCMCELAVQEAMEPNVPELALFTSGKVEEMAKALKAKWGQLHDEVVRSDRQKREACNSSTPALALVHSNGRCPPGRH